MEEKSFRDWLKDRAAELEEEKRQARPDMLGKAVALYRDDESRYPDTIRVSFADGHTEIYDLRVKQPAPQFVKSVTIIRKWAEGYSYKPPRRRKG